MEERIADRLEVENIVTLRVAHDPHPKTGKIGFEPLFCDCDQNIVAMYAPVDAPIDPDEYWEENFKSVRFFNPTNFGFELKPGEDWQARVEKITILPASKLTRDGRRFVFIYVCVLDRKEWTEHEFADIANVWITRVISGGTVISSKREPAERETREYRSEVPAHFQRYWGQRDELALTVEEIRVEGRIVRQQVLGCRVRECYERCRQVKLGDLKHPFGGTVDPKMARKFAPPPFGELARLPEEIEIPRNMRIYR